MHNCGRNYSSTTHLQKQYLYFFSDKIVQGKAVAQALSSTHITSNYQSPANEFQSPEIMFKFSINRKDNEMRPGVNHTFNCIAKNGSCETPLIKFGKQFKDETKVVEKTYLAANTKLKIRLDMRDVLAALKKDGYFTTFNGDKIYAADFKELYVAGATTPMVWDFDNLHQRPQLEMKDPDGDGIYETTMILNEEKKERDLAAEWTLTKDIAAFPQYHSDYPMSDAIYNMSLEEMQKAIEPDSTFRTGKEWAGVWTRDISYSIILSMAYLQPKVAKYSLLKKVKNGKIIQDTGTGGAYPNSTDRMIWAVAAWELYKATGDKDWLQQAYTIIKNSIDDDILNVHDKLTGMVRGESSFLDWREQTYPKWMQPADIFESECLGTNAVHYQANMVLANMAMQLKKIEEGKKYAGVAFKIKKGMNHYLWMPEKGYYGQYLYGNCFKSLSTKSEALGEALTVIFHIADISRARSVVANTPVTAFGLPCIFPQIENIPAYHNNAVWPFVQSYWAQAAARAGNETAVLESISAIYRPAAMFLTNKENFVVNNGDYKGTVINSSNMLWSLSGNISLIHKVIFGIEYLAEGLAFHPFVPEALKGKRSLTNFTYRNSILDIEMEGFGNTISSFTIDGKESTDLAVKSNLEGKHSIKIILKNNSLGGKINEVKNIFALETPSVEIENSKLKWGPIKGARSYLVYWNGVKLAETGNTILPVADSGYSEYQVMAVGDKNNNSFLSQPVVVPNNPVNIIEAENIVTKADLPYKGFSGEGFVDISKQKNTTLNIPVTITADGTYAIDFKYANGNGPTNTENKCAIRTLKEGDDFLGTVIFPQRGVEEWSNWGFSNPVQVKLKKGKHIISLSFEPANENMNVDVNQAMLDFVRVTKLY
ncbi:MAG: hypothetical protein QM737_18040 [Ferruginibacter sp.]